MVHAVDMTYETAQMHTSTPTVVYCSTPLTSSVAVYSCPTGFHGHLLGIACIHTCTVQHITVLKLNCMGTNTFMKWVAIILYIS